MKVALRPVPCEVWSFAWLVVAITTVLFVMKVTCPSYPLLTAGTAVTGGPHHWFEEPTWLVTPLSTKDSPMDISISWHILLTPYLSRNRSFSRTTIFTTLKSFWTGPWMERAGPPSLRNGYLP